MSQIKAKALEQAIKILDALNCQYLIIDGEGKQHGDLVIAPKKKRAEPEFPYGEIRQYTLPFIKDLKVGEVVEVDAKNYGLERIRGGICTWFLNKYGPGACTTTIKHSNNSIEVLRIY